ncbi:MAG: hypothetical protein KAH18_06570 [Psychromonas sp.]|nr:hypothetical protein [Psychromonas sp.]
MKWLSFLVGIVLLAYPFAIYYGLNQWGIGVVAGFLGLLFFLRLMVTNQKPLSEFRYMIWLGSGAGIILVLLAYLFKNTRWFTYYPVIVNLLFFSLFLISLWQKESIIERFARLQDPQLPHYAVHYTRNVTKVWCLFFILNGTISFTTSFMSLDIWTFYNGFISYFLIGLLFSIEFIARVHVKKKNEKRSDNYV